MPFTIPNIDYNEDGWGPSNDTVPEKYKDVPYYAPFTKGDKLGRASDWQQQSVMGQYQKGGGMSVVCRLIEPSLFSLFLFFLIWCFSLI